MLDIACFYILVFAAGLYCSFCLRDADLSNRSLFFKLFPVMAGFSGWMMVSSFRFLPFLPSSHYNECMNKMFKQKWASGLVSAIAAGLLFYYCTYGLLLTGALSFAPWLQDFFSGMSQSQMALLAFFIGVLVFAFTALSKNVRSLCAAAFLIIFFFWFKARVPGFAAALSDFWNTLASMF